MDVVKRFNNENLNLDIRIMGSLDKPLFLARDVATVLGIKDVNSIIRDFDDDQKVLHPMQTPGGEQKMAALTEEGLYKILFASRKAVAKRFQKWVFSVIHEIRTTGKYELDQALIKQREETDRLIKEKEDQLSQLNSFVQRKHFQPRDIIYLAKMHPSRDDHIYKFGRTADKTSRRKNYRGQRTEPLEFIDTFPVIDYKRAEANLKYILEPYMYSNTSDEVVQMPYELLLRAAKAALYIDKVKINISEEMKNWTPPHVTESVICAATLDEILEVEREFINDDYADNIASDDECEIDDSTEGEDDVANIELDESTDIIQQSVDLDAKIDDFISVNIRHKLGSKFTRVKLQERVKKEFAGEKLTATTKQILEKLSVDKRAVTIKDYELIDYTVDQFVKTHCDLNPLYRIDSVALMEEYMRVTEEPIKVPAQFIAQLKNLGYTSTKNTDGRFIIGLLPKEGSLEQFIRDKCSDDACEITIEDLINAYTEYCKTHSLRPYKRPTIKARMEDLGYAARKYNNGCINFIGIKLR